MSLALLFLPFPRCFACPLELELMTLVTTCAKVPPRPNAQLLSARPPFLLVSKCAPRQRARSCTEATSVLGEHRLTHLTQWHETLLVKCPGFLSFLSSGHSANRCLHLLSVLYRKELHELPPPPPPYKARLAYPVRLPPNPHQQSLSSPELQHSLSHFRSTASPLSPTPFFNLIQNGLLRRRCFL